MKPLTSFERGYICAVANLVKAHDAIVEAKELLNALGPIDWRQVEPYEHRILRERGLIP